jgi:hypothetical protein
MEAFDMIVSETKLTGRAEPPKSSGRILLTIDPAKRKLSINLLQ